MRSLTIDLSTAAIDQYRRTLPFDYLWIQVMIKINFVNRFYIYYFEK